MFIGINNISALDTSLKVYDYAQVLTPSEEDALRLKVNLFIANYNMDMVLVTVKNHNNINTMNYADDFYDYNGFGIGPNKDGVLFVIDLKYGYKDVWMSTTGKAINYYTDARIDSIIDEVALQKNNGYYKMFAAFVDKTNYYAKLGLPTSEESYSDDRTIPNILIFSILIPSIIIMVFVFKNRMVKASTTAGEYLLKDSLVINKRNDRFITTHTTSVRIESSSSGGFGSGSSTHRSSSGRRHGGGGRRL